MSSVILAAVADDDTGATDLAGMLQEQGVRTIVVFDGTTPEQLASWAADADAVILGTAARSVPRDVAYERTRAATRLLQSLDPRVMFVKYCSTFDSTAEGNIGASIEAALHATGESFTIAVPALPILGRTTYQGYHFVGQKLLSDSPMRNHPLNPMTNSNLVSHLSSQTALKPDLADYRAVSAGPDALRLRFAELQNSGVGVALVDCISQADVQTIAEAAMGMRLLTGSSALASVLPGVWARTGWWQTPACSLPLPARDRGGSGFLIVAGSCSVATQAQNKDLKSRGCVSIAIDPVSLCNGLTVPEDTIVAAIRALQDGRTCLVQSTSDRAEAEAVQAWADEGGISSIEAGERISRGLAEVTRHLLDHVRPEGLILAGGETAGTTCRVLGLGCLTVGPPIDPGVPVCVSIAGSRLPVVLKSGNFGGDDFYCKAVEAIRRLPYSDKLIEDSVKL